LAVGISMLGMLADSRVLAEEKEQTVSFLHEVLPILTRASCNSGACHGTPSGKNGFRLSLRGYDPGLDFQSLTREAQGRRINRVEPDASLLLLKASGQMPHGGGRRFDRHSRYYDLLSKWIAQGANDDSSRASRLTKLQIVPERQILVLPKSDLELRVQAR